MLTLVTGIIVINHLRKEQSNGISHFKGRCSGIIFHPLLPDEFTHRHIPVVDEPYNINPTGQVADIKLRFGFGDPAIDEYLTDHIQN